MTREEAYKFLTDNVHNENLLRHHFAAEAVMKTLADNYNSQKTKPEDLVDKNEWGIVGLLHDADYEQTRSYPEKHGIVLAEKLAGKLDPRLIRAILTHNAYWTKIEPESPLEWSLYCSDELTGIIVASALIHPDKKLSSLTTDFVLNKFKEKSFAKGANRDQVKMCEEKLGINLTDFVGLALKAMQGISQQLGL